MFLGTQGDLIAMIAETREELENMPCITFTEIIETNKPVKMVDGKYYIEAENIFSKN
ncbi:MAG: hypothetical protein IKB10_00300 [Alphaproteobacteria bacterium]|nr:hypothetical protein [Alphaproteobacteria bacterium]